MTDQMPDFDSMSPEELMAWMESLAKRQGAHEGFTTAADMEVAEIDPNTVSVDEPGYIPYGMDTEKWEAKKAEEERLKQERLAQMSTSKPAAPAPQPVHPTPTPAPAPTPPAPEPMKAQPAAEVFDPENMTPEQLMAWMESLAKRQGADEGFTTTADMKIAEVDASAVQLDEPGYIPYGMDAATWERKQEEERKRKEARRAQSQAPAPQPVQPTPPPAPTPAPEPEPPFALEQSVFDFELDETIKAEPTAQGEDALAWLESIAAGSTADTPQIDFNFDALNELGQSPAAATPSDDPLAWLESLSQGGDNLAGLAQFSIDNLADTPPAPPAPKTTSAPEPSDSLEWLESLAKRQGANEEELVTSASIDVPMPSQIVSDAPGYTDFTIDSTPAATPSEFDFELELPLDDAAFDVDKLDSDADSDWLSALAAGQINPNMPPFIDETQAPQAEVPTKEILNRLEQGQNVSSDEMADWMSNLLEQGAKRNVPDYIDDEEESDSLEQSDLPDWLLQQVGTPPIAETPAPAPLTEDIIEPPAPDMPEWLRDSFEEEAEELSFDSIFADEIEQGAVITDEHEVVSMSNVSTEELAVNVDDPWVEAFEEERRSGNDIPDWYRERLQQVSSGEPVSPEVTFNDAPLPAAILPDESELSMGEPQDVPDWLGLEATEHAPYAVETAAAVVEPDDSIEKADLADMPAWLKQQITSEQPTTAADDIPDWLKEAGIEEVTAEEVPAWLMESPVEETPAPVVQAPVPQPEPVPQYKPVASPAPVVSVPATADVSAALNEARRKASAGEIDSALVSYEAVVRANSNLDVVVADLSKMLNDEKLKKNPAIYRVLGDGLMRQGELQQALDTYRKALNLL